MVVPQLVVLVTVVATVVMATVRPRNRCRLYGTAF